MPNRGSSRGNTRSDSGRGSASGDSLPAPTHTNFPRYPSGAITPTKAPTSPSNYFDQQGGLYNGIRRFFGRFTGQTQLADQYAFAGWELENNERLLDEAREYDAPKEQVERMLEGGLNPALMYAGGQGLSGGSNGAATAHGGDGSGGEGLPGILSTIAGVIGIKNSVAGLKNAQMENIFNATTLKERIKKLKDEANTSKEIADLREMETNLGHVLYETGPGGAVKHPRDGYTDPTWSDANSWAAFEKGNQIDKTRADARSAEHGEVMTRMSRKFMENTENSSQYLNMALMFMKLITGGVK